MNNEEFNKRAEIINKDFISERDRRVSKPHVNIVPENTAKYLVLSKNWVLNSDHAEIMMDKPNDIALYSSLAMSNLNEAIILYEKLFADKTPIKFLKPHEGTSFYNYFEKISASLIFAYTSIESLSNILIPINFQMEIKDKAGALKTLDKSAIERKFPLRDKLKVVLKDILNTTEPNKETWWQSFILLEDIRNELIHVKPSKSEERYSKLLLSSIFDIVKVHLDIISYYGKCIDLIDSEAINDFPYGFNSDRIKPYKMTEVNFDKAWKGLRNIPD